MLCIIHFPSVSNFQFKLRFQEYYTEDFNHCYKCGTNNEFGHQLKTYPRCITTSLMVDYLKPTPIGCTLELRGKINDLKGRKVVIDVSLIADEEVCAKGELSLSKFPIN